MTFRERRGGECRGAKFRETPESFKSIYLMM